MGFVSNFLLRKIISENSISKWSHKRCDTCKAPQYYVFYPTYVILNNFCDCKKSATIKSYDELANFFNLKSAEEREKALESLRNSPFKVEK